MPSKSQHPRPRLCTLEKGDNGYGFHLHGEKGKTGQFIRLVEPDSPAETSGLHAGDRLVFVNGEDVENESHQQVVSRIRATVGRLVLVVVDPDTEQLLKKHNMKCLKEHVSDGIPLPFDEEEGGEVMVEEEVVVEQQQEHRDADGTVNGDERHDKEGEEEEEETPRESTPVPKRNGGEIHVHVEKKLSINSEKVNSLSVEGKTHSEVVAAIKAGGKEARLLVVDPDTDAFFKRCRVAPALDHLSGPLPEPVINGGLDEKVNGRGATERDSMLSVSPSPSNASSNTSLTTLPTNTPPEGFIADAIPALNMSLQQVKELAHQKRSSKRAPPMDWTKKNELFSNL
ncbi:Na(+)/H(+) exchange regulatory cofactor NHE-RF1-like isoform X2 [Pseudoliparis swirei]|uniref:Na(+)/H(+) exchange regulatory cofactor NHE-RF1-like isoform X2 n=1 Tax=Pseudoliparis swirei TaxID=2059687 RepID=UPI0024BDE571|nr:Na(+)/H(+) exchange regulatory cofactor NHE-RF1-like isoform X2 [Pseudoliparis swirei]